MSIALYKQHWVDEPTRHEAVNTMFATNVNENELLNDHRTWVTENAFGFGERSFHWLWKIIVDEMPKEFSFLEIGVFRGQILSLIELLAKENGKTANRYGVTPLDNSDGHWDSDYAKDIEIIHDMFDLAKDYTIYHGLSTDNEIIEQAKSTAPYDIVYLDGGHTYEVVTSDLKHYPNMVKVGGLFIVDDSCNNMKMPWGFFQGIESVTQATLEWENSKFDFQFNVVHNRIYKRVA